MQRKFSGIKNKYELTVLKKLGKTSNWWKECSMSCKYTKLCCSTSYRSISNLLSGATSSGNIMFYYEGSKFWENYKVPNLFRIFTTLHLNRWIRRDLFLLFQFKGTIWEGSLEARYLKLCRLTSEDGNSHHYIHILENFFGEGHRI